MLNKLVPTMSICAEQDETAKNGKFGFAVDNTIGGTPQENGWMDDWVAFFRERRLKPQLARTNDAQLQQMGQQLMDNLESFFEGIEVRALAMLYGHAELPKMSLSSTICTRHAWSV